MRDSALDSPSTESVSQFLGVMWLAYWSVFSTVNDIPGAGQFYKEVFLAQTSASQKFKHPSTGSGHNPCWLHHFMADSNGWDLEHVWARGSIARQEVRVKLESWEYYCLSPCLGHTCSWLGLSTRPCCFQVLKCCRLPLQGQASNPWTCGADHDHGVE